MPTHLALGKLPSAREAKELQRYVKIGRYAVSHDPSDQRQNMRFLWRVHGPELEDGTRDILEDFATYRDAVKDASTRERRDLDAARSSYWRLSNEAPALLKAIDEALETLLDHYDSCGGLHLEPYNEVLWTLIRAADRARGRKTSKTLPDAWGEEERSTP